MRAQKHLGRKEIETRGIKSTPPDKWKRTAREKQIHSNMGEGKETAERRGRKKTKKGRVIRRRRRRIRT